ncbi:unnamed protein product [Ambrosiozyma monospora]|uniref:Unnamed protein product n=1 Tax=Ambrosiozyma monospora TaxID=43982 RepID=A0A9W6Z1K2_AMBMO|nr:unnamed protein product [Ambrosiozyma monospora]
MSSEESYIFQNQISKKAPMLVKASGIHITYEDPATKKQHTVIDAMTGAAVGSLGYHDPDVIAAMKDAAETSNYSFGMYFGNYASEELSKFIISRSPKDHFASCLWVGSGSEANENMMKIVKQYYNEIGETKRRKFISRLNAYHGFTIGALSLGQGIRKADFEDILLKEGDQCFKVSSCYPYHVINEEFTEADYTKQLLDELENKIVANDPDTIACVVLETVGGSSVGTVCPPAGYLDGVRALCDKYGILLSLDEVMVGLGRAGAPYYHTYEKFMTSGKGPDLMTIGKTIASGYATIAGVMISPKVKKAIVSGSDAIAGAQTYHCHEFNCKIALAVQKKLYEKDIIKTGGEAGQYLMDILKRDLKDSKIVGNVRGLPLFHSVEFCNPATKEPFDPSLKIAYRVHDKALENGITTMGLSGSIGEFTTKDSKTLKCAGDHISVGPAYIITKSDAELIAKALVDAIKSVEKEIYPDSV